MNMPLALLNRRRRGAAFSPTRLFALAEPGIWLDPSDLTTLFQDTAGTTPVTATGQSVALALDKSKGLVLGAELVTNGGFDSGANWTADTGWTISGGAATTAAGTTGALYQSISLVAGRSYRVNFTISNTISGGILPSFFGGTTVFGPAISGNGSKSVLITAASGNTELRFFKDAASAALSLDNISVRELAGAHATQATAASRPTYQIVNGKPCLQFDGVDDFLVTPTITPNIDKAQVFAGVRKLSDAAVGVVVESSVNAGANAGSLMIYSGSDQTIQARARGSIDVALATTALGAAPLSFVTTLQGDIAGDTSSVRVNGVSRASSIADQGTGNFLAYPIYIGRRAGTSFPLNGQLYSLVVRFGANLDAAAISNTETWVAGKTGVTI